MLNIEKSTLTSLLTGKLAFKVYNNETSEWQSISVFNPELEAHAGAKATSSEAGHVKLVTDLESQSEEIAASAKSVAIVFEALGVHVNEEESHINNMERIKWNNYSNSANISYANPVTNADNIKTAIDELFQSSNDFRKRIAQIIGVQEIESGSFSDITNKITELQKTLKDKLLLEGKEIPEGATLQELINLV